MPTSCLVGLHHFDDILNYLDQNPELQESAGRGKPHHCTAAEAVKNLTKKALEIGANFGQSGSKSYLRVSSNLIKAAEAEQNVPRGEAMKLATGKEV